MKKKFFNLLLLLPSMVFTTCTAVGCGESIDAITLNDVTVDYDGNVHSVVVENLPSGATVTYKGNDKVNPGTYTVTATITFSDGSVTTKTATLFIRKNESVLVADAVQTATTYGGAVPAYSLNNDSQEVVVAPIYRAGRYKVELYAKANDFYKESNHVIVDFKVVDGNPLNVSFASQKIV